MLNSGLVLCGPAISGLMAIVRRVLLSVAVCFRARSGPSVAAGRAAWRARGRGLQLDGNDTNSVMFRSAGAACLAPAISHPASLA